MKDKIRESQIEKIFSINRSIQKNIRKKFEKFAKEYGLTSPQLSVIFKIYETPSITLHELSKHMKLTKSTVSGIVDRLTKQGIVVREIPRDNRRIVNLSISEEFKKKNDICSIKKRFVNYIISDSENFYTFEELEKIICALEKLNSLLDD